MACKGKLTDPLCGPGRRGRPLWLTLLTLPVTSSRSSQSHREPWSVYAACCPEQRVARVGAVPSPDGPSHHKCKEGVEQKAQRH